MLMFSVSNDKMFQDHQSPGVSNSPISLVFNLVISTSLRYLELSFQEVLVPLLLDSSCEKSFSFIFLSNAYAALEYRFERLTKLSLLHDVSHNVFCIQPNQLQSNIPR